jgi:hypothetical protein
MNISKDVIRDLLPSYVAGEASADTRALVEQSLGGDPDLRTEAEALGAIPVADLAPPAALEFSSLKRTQLLLRRRVFLVGFGYLFTTLPLALAGRDWGPVWLGVPAVRLLSTACFVAAVAGWIAFLRNARELFGAGFEPAPSRGPLLAWGLGICWIANSAAVVVSDWMPWHVNSYFGVFVLLLIYPFWTVGRKLRQFRTLDELDRPQSLFHGSNDRNEM